MREYHEVFSHKLPPLTREPVLSDFYTPTDEQHYREEGIHSVEHDWNQESPVLSRELNYITNRNIPTFLLPYRYISILQCLQPEPISFVIPNQLRLSLY